MAIEKFKGKFGIDDGGCTIIINETINLIRNGDGAALYVYLVCRPPQWELNITQLMSHFSWGKTKTYNALTYLQELKLLQRVDHREKGRFIHHEYRLKLRPYSPLPRKQEVDETQASIESSPLPKNREVVNTAITQASTDFSPLPCLPEVATADTYKTKISIKQRKIKNKEEERTQNMDLDLITKDNPLASLLPEKYLLTQNFLNKQCLDDEKARSSFQVKFGKMEVTFEEMLCECVMYYALKPVAQNVSAHRFRSWIKNERTDLYDKKPDSVAHKLYRDLTPTEKSLIADYSHFKKYPELKNSLTQAQCREAQELIALLKSTQNMRTI